MRRVSALTLSLALIGLAVAPAQARSAHRGHARHVAHPVRHVVRPAVTADADAGMRDLFQRGPVLQRGVQADVAVHARQSQFYANENYYADSSHWGY